MTVLLKLVCALLVASAASFEYFPKFSEECDVWAGKDGECVNNPAFMWSKCLRSCIDQSEDDNDKCEGWAEEGECTNNPLYIHIHCPRSCKMAIAWSPWVRNALGEALLPVLMKSVIRIKIIVHLCVCIPCRSGGFSLL